LTLSSLGAPYVAPSSFIARQMAAYDALPAAIRAAVAGAPYGNNAVVIFARYARGHSEAELRAFLDDCRRRSAQEAVARGAPPGSVGWPPIVARPGRASRAAGCRPPGAWRSSSRLSWRRKRKMAKRRRRMRRSMVALF